MDKSIANFFILQYIEFFFFRVFQDFFQNIHCQNYYGGFAPRKKVILYCIKKELVS
jgi:hypothetical protein